ncbi:MAG: archaetidylserine decarboxylase [Gammaproteobacteria bacterium]|nr:MAG: archaetidylserine decarboxylase [Gammaproteobacteria bacterium]
MSDFLKSLPFYLLPTHLITRISYSLARIEWPPIKNRFIDLYLYLNPVNLDEAEITDRYAYGTLNSFFTRALKPGARPIYEGSNNWVSPVDGTISQIGKIKEGRIFQAKGQDYSLHELMGGKERLAAPFINGRFATIYLSPQDYHRIHMPLAGDLRETVYLPGRLFSVAPHTVRAVPQLFSRNERLVCCFETASGPIAVVMIGAINVAAMETVWQGSMPHEGQGGVCHALFGDDNIHLHKGTEMGRFNLGSTVILLASDNVTWDASLKEGVKLELGQRIGQNSCA